MMKLKEIIGILDSWAPFALQEEWDNSGLLLGDPDMEITGIMISLDTTSRVLDEALDLNCNVIISHHPFLFKGITRLTSGMTEFSIIRSAMNHGIAVVSVHTNLDNRAESLNHFLGRRIGLENLRILNPASGLLKKLVTFCPGEHAEKVRNALFDAGAGHIGNYDCCSFNASGQGTFRASEKANPYVGKRNALHFEDEIRIEIIFPGYLESRLVTALLTKHPYEEVAYDIYPLGNRFQQAGAGILGELGEQVPADDFLRMVKHVLGLTLIRHTKAPGVPINKVAICSGAGAFLIPDILKQDVDAFLTGDLKYHDFQAAPESLLLADIGHFESERFVKEILRALLIEKFPNFAVLISEREKNPVKYF